MNPGTSNTAADSDCEVELKLFVRGSTASSNAAIHQLRHFCAEQFEAGSWQLEIVDLHDEPDVANRFAVLATPSVLLRRGDNATRLTGDLRDVVTMADEIRRQI